MQQKNGGLPLPLDGIRILDATHIVAGPFCTLILADMGAEVIKIERPKTGELNRSRGDFIQGSDGRSVSARFLGLNRNKKSVTMDLRDPTCKAAFEAMVASSDVLVDNWGPGALDRLGLGYDRLREVNQGLVYATITGYGDNKDLQGPYSSWPANNLCVQGMGGWMGITGTGADDDNKAQSVGENVGDSVPGLWTALAIVLALETRRKTGMGQHVDMAMYECMAVHTQSNMAAYQATGYDGPQSPESAISAGLVLRTQDGQVVLAGARPERSWEAMWRMLGREDLLQDPRYVGKGATPDFYHNRVVPAIEEWSKQLTRTEVCSRLTQAGFSMGMVQTMGDLDSCPHMDARGMFVDAGDTFGGNYRSMITPIRLTGCVDMPKNTPPTLGADNDDVLSGIGGLSKSEVEQLREDGAI
ncbi:MAG: hypothetical protein BZY88_13615 [SAR202 cluster bacterium Io17-Chloro-G9]|nr:MAG: hypothetical protein BZY88_13615 [SAR202 cluster bacterium Io17-Chloro-G9]